MSERRLYVDRTASAAPRPLSERRGPAIDDGRTLNLRAGALALAALGCALGGCGGEESRSPVTAPGRDETAKTQALETGAALLQGKAPLRELNAYLNGFHFKNGAMQEQMEAHHYCGHLNEEVIQCVIYDGDVSDAKLMGVEYIISAALFARLPAEEKHLWHSHAYEVTSGQLIAPGVPAPAEHELMEKLVSTYGKTWHTWHIERHDALPLGTPILMMGFTADGQADAAMTAARDQRFEISSAQTKARRADIQRPPIDPDADAWQKGIVLQIQAQREQQN